MRSEQDGPHLEEPVEDVGQRKIGAQLLVGDAVLGLAQALRPEAHVPVPQLALKALQGAR